MKILQIASLVPYPPIDGGRVGIYNLTRQYLRHGMEVHFAAPRVKANDAETFGRDVHLHFFDVDPRNSLLGIARNLGRTLPYTVEKYHSQTALQQLCTLMEQERFDVIHVDYLNLAWYGIELRERYGVPVLLREHNFQSEIFERLHTTATNPVIRWYAGVQYRRLLAYEQEAVQRVDVVAAISARDEAKLRALAPAMHSRVVPAGVNFKSFVVRHHQQRNTVLFWASYDWLANRDSYDFFSGEVIPRLVRLLPEVRVLVAGKMTEKLPPRKRLPNMEVAGFVTDPNTLSTRANVAVIPLRIGGGVRIKLLELMAMGMAVVSTSVGAEGVDVTSGKNILIADDPDAFAEAVVSLLQSPAESERLGTNARSLVEEHYSWDSVGDRLSEIVAGMTRSQKMRKNEA